MFCNKCGKEGREGELFCWACGAPKGENAFQQPVIQVPVNNNSVPEQKKKMPTWLTILLIIGGTLSVGIVVFVAFCFFVVLNVNTTTAEYYEQTVSYVFMGEDNIPTLYNLVGEYDLCEIPHHVKVENNESYEYSYCDDYLDIYVLDDYADYLIDSYDYTELESDEDYRTVVKDSVEEGYVIKVTVYYYRESIEYVREVKEDNTL